MTGDDITHKAKSAASSVASSLKESGREALADVKSRAAGAASRTAEAARAEAVTRGEAAKDTLASQGDRLAQSIRDAMGGGDGSIQSRVLGVVADSVEDLTGSLRNRSVQTLLSDAEAFARKNPGAFVAAAALAGFALARFARASTPEPEYDPSTPAVSQGYATMPPAHDEGGTGYGSPRPTGMGYASSSVSTHGMSTHDDEPGPSSVDAMPDDEDSADGASTGLGGGPRDDGSRP